MDIQQKIWDIFFKRTFLNSITVLLIVVLVIILSKILTLDLDRLNIDLGILTEHPYLYISVLALVYIHQFYCYYRQIELLTLLVKNDRITNTYGSRQDDTKITLRNEHGKDYLYTIVYTRQVFVTIDGYSTTEERTDEIPISKWICHDIVEEFKSEQ